MEKSVEPRQFELPLELQFSMKKAEIAAKDMTWEELYWALLNLYHQRLMEWQAVKEILAGENIELNFDVPTELEPLPFLKRFGSAFVLLTPNVFGNVALEVTTEFFRSQLRFNCLDTLDRPICVMDRMVDIVSKQNGTAFESKDGICFRLGCPWNRTHAVLTFTEGQNVRRC
jgi:hypothetical protein